MNVNAVLSAGFMHAGERFRVTAQLLDVASGDILWSDRIDAAASDIITVQDTIAQRIVDGLRLELSPDEQATWRAARPRTPRPTKNTCAGATSSGASSFARVAPEDCDAAIAHFQRAIELDPSFALAHDGLGACYVNRVFKGFGSAEDYERAEAAFNKALALDPRTCRSAHADGLHLSLARRKTEGARRGGALARQISERSCRLLRQSDAASSRRRIIDRALRSYDRLVKLDPAAHVVAHCNRALIYIYQGRFDDAMRELDEAASERA